MWLDNIEYRDELNLNKDIKFGIEIEFDKARKRYVSEVLEDAYKNKVINKKWDVVYDETINSFKSKSHTRGGEAVSSILNDTKETWNNIKYTCDTIKYFGGKINNNCGAHVHLDASILKDNMKYYDRLMKLWIIFEDVIIRFCYGEKNNPRNMLDLFSKSPYVFFKVIYDNYYKNNKLNLTFEQFVKGPKSPTWYKNLSVSFRGLDEDFLKKKYNNNDNWYNHRTIEFRACNGTLNHIVWQNYVNLWTKLFLCCINDSKDWDKIDKLFIKYYNNYKKSDKYNIEKAIYFSDFIFDNDIDKYNFMLQYIKEEKYATTKPKIRGKVL